MVLTLLIKGVFCKIFLLYIKISESVYSTYQRNRGVMLNRAKDYYENDKEKLREQSRNKEGNLPEEEKN